MVRSYRLMERLGSGGMGEVWRPAGLRYRRARGAQNPFPPRRPPKSNPDKYADQLLDACLFIEDADALYAEYVARGVEFTRALGGTAWHSREFVVKDCDGRLLAFGIKRANEQASGSPVTSIRYFAFVGALPCSNPVWPRSRARAAQTGRQPGSLRNLA